jgi:isopropylmalate/homocitrate/citramalate synthase
MSNKQLTILDCTLRDGEQAPGVFFTTEEKIAIADLLNIAGVDMLDAGMPSVSEQERESLKRLRERGYRATIAGTVRATRLDVDYALECGLSDVFLFMPVSPQHLQHKFGKTLAQIRPALEDVLRYAIDNRLRTHFVAEDTVRAQPAELAPVLDSVAEIGAASVMICDTVGVSWPQAMTQFIGELKDRMRREIELGIHCHNDYGLAVANTLAAVAAGCTLVSGTINGLGERAGNASLDEVICALENLLHLPLTIHKRVLPLLSRAVARTSGVFMTPTKPIVGLNVFRHESGVHVDAMLKDLSTYESIDPNTVGGEHEYILGKHSGTGLVRFLLRQKGVETDPQTVQRILERVKAAKVSMNKDAVDEMEFRLNRFWATHLAFDEKEFWEIAAAELKARQPASAAAD